MSETWKAVKGINNLEVSSEGNLRRVKATRRIPALGLLKPSAISNGYLRVTISELGRTISLSVHRTVCEAFHGAAPSPLHQACHINGTKSDNRASNLKWGTSTENQNDKRGHGTLASGERIAQSKLTENDVRNIRRLAASGVSRLILARLYEVDKTNIGCILRNETWRHLS